MSETPVTALAPVRCMARTDRHGYRGVLPGWYKVGTTRVVQGGYYQGGYWQGLLKGVWQGLLKGVWQGLIKGSLAGPH